jgi:hypothetical protein
VRPGALAAPEARVDPDVLPAVPGVVPVVPVAVPVSLLVLAPVPVPVVAAGSDFLPAAGAGAGP